MAKDDKTKDGGSSRLAESRVLKMVLILLSILLIFVGPTYIPYLMIHHLYLDFAASMIFGLALFVVGIVMMAFLVRKNIVN